MTTSGVRTWTLNFVDAMEEAYDRCGAAGNTAYAVKSARRSANLLLTEWQNRGYNLWTVASLVVPLTANQTNYTLGTDVVDIIDATYTLAGRDRNLDRKALPDYISLNNKQLRGAPTQYYLQRSVAPVMMIWPSPSTATGSITIWYVRRMEDAPTTGSQLFPFPNRLLPAFVAGLAYYLSLKIPEAANRVSALEAAYEKAWRMATEEDRDRSSWSIVPDLG